MVGTSFLFSLEPVSDCKSLEQPIASVWSLTKRSGSRVGLPSRPEVPRRFEGDWFSELFMQISKFPNPELPEVPEVPRWPATSLGPSRFHEASSLEFLDTSG